MDSSEEDQRSSDSLTILVIVGLLQLLYSSIDASYTPVLLIIDGRKERNKLKQELGTDPEINQGGWLV